MNKSVTRPAGSLYQALMSAPKRRSQTLHALTSDALGPAFGKCRACHGFDTVTTQTGIAVCANPMHSQDRPALPMRPTPHERDGRQPSPEPARPHALLVG
ncbi:hypothetical protein ACFVZD_37100 [Streptomyces sp. NPDC058287]|uniref:hypothetical protein n=1 Tax=Streptomyces sp. NPDC058287 TaxID=3346423 RepID=UPI0036EF830C